MTERAVSRSEQDDQEVICRERSRKQPKGYVAGTLQNNLKVILLTLAHIADLAIA
jgi:hypothetical protein